MSDTNLAPLIAIIGCDGAGKSTLVDDLVSHLGRTGTIAKCYLGLGSGTLAARIAKAPLIGRIVERKLSNKARLTRSRDSRIPGLATALTVFGFSMLRRWRFRRAMVLRSAGVTVITDRYPQIEVPGFYDGPGLSAARAGSQAVAWLASVERNMYVRMAAYRPTLVIRLDLDLATAIARKPDHDVALLEQKIAVTPMLRLGGARIVDLDSRAPYADVRRHALAAIHEAIG